MKETVLRQNTQFRAVYYRGKSKTDPLLIVFVRKNKQPFSRVGITTGKKVGNAVMRSRCRRVIRAAYRALQPRVTAGYDIVFVARSKTAFVKSDAVKDVMQRLLRELGVLS